ncbi:unnamed protein product [Rotaria sp. Silwood1]|nr:unnamed protein product [Rotaria sp. Silwood1]CAF3658371.1 unnamed protein product [Rotaria sp. Silwood1]CAF3767952.1 unnamed protein product [Rotaria sp. Silwood1]CAF4715955.1 unnamed protein product [Rotaria sp. Silwood1]CAF4790449.1 unnamed protein product [Rotaria sp. Silwood1]
MDIMIYYRLQNFYTILISLMSIFNVSFIYMIDENDEDIINEATDEYSETVTEIPLDPAVQIEYVQIDVRIVHTINQNYIGFGQTQPCYPVQLLFIKIQKLISRIYYYKFHILLGICSCIYVQYYATKIELSINKSLEIYDKLMLIPLNNTYQDLIMNEEHVSSNINSTVESKVDVVINDEITSIVKNNESNVKDMLKVNSEIILIDNLTCTLYNPFLYAFTKTFCWKDDIKDFSPAEPPDDTHSFYDSNKKKLMNLVENSITPVEKADELLSCFQKFFIDILNDEQLRQQRLMNENAISETASIDVLSDQILQNEENAIDENKVDDEKFILPTYLMGMHFEKQRNHVCPDQE